MFCAPFPSLPPLNNKRSNQWAKHIENRIRGYEEGGRDDIYANPALLTPVLDSKVEADKERTLKRRRSKDGHVTATRFTRRADAAHHSSLPPWRPNGRRTGLVHNSSNIFRARSLEPASQYMSQTSPPTAEIERRTYQRSGRHTKLSPLPSTMPPRLSLPAASDDELPTPSPPHGDVGLVLPRPMPRKSVEESKRREAAARSKKRREELEAADKRREERRLRREQEHRRFQELRRAATTTPPIAHVASDEDELPHRASDTTFAGTLTDTSEISPMSPNDNLSEGSGDEDASSASSNGEDRHSIVVDLPGWHPNELPLPGIVSPRSKKHLKSLQPSQPSVEALGPGKISISWNLQGIWPVGLTWHARIREAGQDKPWRKIDFDAHRVCEPNEETTSWKHKAFLVQPGLKILSFCVKEGRKSIKPLPGTVVSHFPGLVTIDFEVHPGVSVRQRVPQEWVLLAATANTLQDIAKLLSEHSRVSRDESVGKRMWTVARHKVFERVLRSFRQCSVIWSQRCVLPPPGSRLSIDCSMGLSSSNNDSAAENTCHCPENQDEHVDHARSQMIQTYWPALLDEVAESLGDDRPSELCVQSDLKVYLEPWPRIQVIPRHWVSVEIPEAEKAKKNACVDQRVLAHYSIGNPPAFNDASAEAYASHPEPREEFDVTLLAGDRHLAEAGNAESVSLDFEASKRSERCVRGTILRELVSPAEVHVYLKRRNRKHLIRVPLSSIYRVHSTTSDLASSRKKQRKVYEWLVLRREGRSSEVVARQGPASQVYGVSGWDESVPLLPGLKVSYFPPGAADLTVTNAMSMSSSAAFLRRLTDAKIVRVSARTTHYEVCFDEVLPESHWTSAYSVAWHSKLDGTIRRVRQPELVISSIPRDLTDVEVQIGVSEPTGSFEEIVWSQSSVPCRVPKVSIPVVQLPPSIRAQSFSRVEVRWILPQEPAALCFKVALREVGAKEWRAVDASGYANEEDLSFDWRTRLIPLVEGLWASAFGDFDNRKAATPGAAQIININTLQDAIKVDFEPPSHELCIGGAPNAPIACIQCSQSFINKGEEKEHTIPSSWIEAVWVRDGSNVFLKGSPLMSYIASQEVQAKRQGNCKAIQVVGDAEPMQVIRNEHWPTFLSSDSDTVQLAMHEVAGLKPETAYEIRVLALTTSGLTEWCEPAVIRMPRIGYEQEELVSERRANAFYRANLLPQAVYKQYDKCWASVEESLTTERLERLKAALGKHEDAPDVTYDVELSRWLVDMEGPIRRSPDMLDADVRKLLKDLVNKNANVNYRDQATGRTPLTYACEYGRTVRHSVVEELLSLRADVDSMNDSRRTALLIAAAGGHTHIVKTLLSKGADVTIVSLQGETATMAARPQRGMTKATLEGVRECRRLLCEKRERWERFEASMRHTENPAEAAKAFLKIAFPGGRETMFVTIKDEKRISKFDQLRLYEQIMEAREQDSNGRAESDRRGEFCARKLLLQQIRAAALQDPPNTECSHFARYLLMSDVMKWCMREAKELAIFLLDHFQKELTNQRSQLQRLPGLTTKADTLCGDENKTRKEFAGRLLHQWHAHDDLPWLTEGNVVGTFEALVHCGAVHSMEQFCSWVGELNAQICASDGLQATVQLGAWDKRLPFYFWGGAYVKFLMGEASRAAPVFHNIARELVKKVGGKVSYRDAPNKGIARIVKKQCDYASPGLTLLHEALDLMPGVFRKAFRADLEDEGVQDVSDFDERPTGITLVIGQLGERLQHSFEAVHLARAADFDPQRKVSRGGVIVILRPETVRSQTQEASTNEDPSLPVKRPSSPTLPESKEDLEADFLAAGAAAVIFEDKANSPLDAAEARRLLNEGLRTLRQRQAEQHGENPANACVEEIVPPSAEKAQILFDIRKCRTGSKADLLCAGGLLDLVRGSITCHTEDEVMAIYDLALGLTFDNDQAVLVRVKNGFHTPAIGGYCDLKLFLLIAAKSQASEEIRQVNHICELQVHLNSFLECKKFTHMPYVIDRGDFDSV